MSRFADTYALLLVVVLLVLTQVGAAADWPVKGNVDLSSAFGEFRSNRFHAGVDIRTGGKIGTNVYSPVSGYVWRIKTSYDGYGKGLYIKNSSNHIFVFGHLDSFAPKIDSLVKSVQNSSRRYYQDLYFPADSIPISQGELIAVSGRTGTRGPHLHFEVRNPDNKPLNPLLHNYVVRDIERPIFERIKFQAAGEGSLFPTGQRTLEHPAVIIKNKLVYNIDTVFYFNKPFGVHAAAFDLSRRGGMPLTPYLLALFYDDSLYYEVAMDTLDFDVQRSVNLEYDVVAAAEGKKRVRRLYHRTGNAYNGSRSHSPGNGVFGTLGYEEYGLHQGKIIAMDQMGYIVEMFFDFVWGPDEDLYSLDSTEGGAGGQATYYLSPGIHRNDIPVDSAVVLEEIGGQWAVSTTSTVTFDEKRKITLRTDNNAGRTAMQLVVYAFDCEIRDAVITGLSDIVPSNVTAEYEVVDDGLLVTVRTDVSGPGKPAVELYSGDSLLGVEYAGFYRGDYAAFIAPQSKYSHIDKIVCRLSVENPTAQASVDTDIYLVGAGPNGTIPIGDRYTLNIGEEHFYEPRYIEVRTDRNRPGFVQILPEAFVCRADFEIAINVPTKSNPPPPEGVCWWDKKENEWVWLDNTYSGTSSITSAVTGGGDFDILADVEPPVISQINITDGLTYYDPLQEISFRLDDALSGFDDDRNILIELDGNWMIPEYNPNMKICKTAPLKPLDDGRHELRIVATDRVGHQTEKKLHFYIKRQ